MNNVVEKWMSIETKDELMKGSLSKKHYKESHYVEQMKFGTAGIRGVMGAGSNRINELTIAAAAEAFAQFLESEYKDVKTRGIVLANDNRHNGNLYRETVAAVFANHGIKTYALSDNKVMATPLLSFLIRELNAVGGVNITASHNPKEYNGFKVYNEHGAQVMPNDTSKISAIMDSLDLFAVEKKTDNSVIIDEKHIEKYINEVVSIRFNNLNNLKVAYSPLHGTGNWISKKLFEKMGTNHFLVTKQMKNDPEFKNAKSSNPEDAKAYDKVIALARKKRADVAIVTDPDSDRIGAVVKYKRRYKYLSGNELAVVYLDYKLSQLKKEKKLPKDGYIVKSTVSTDLANLIAKKYKVEVKEVNVGFKNIADVIEKTEGTFLFAFEESYGFLVDSTIARDKDGMQGIVATVDMAEHFKQEGKNIFSRLREIYDEFTIYRNIQYSKTLDFDATKRSMDRIAEAKSFGGLKVEKTIDYRKSKTNKQSMIRVELKGGSWLVVRPSGTEPKVKFYIQTVAAKKEELMHAVILERKIKADADECLEYFADKKFKWSTVLKYLIFAAIVIGLMVFVFEQIYKSYSHSHEVVPTSRKLFSHYGKYIYLIPLAAIAFSLFVDAWMKYRLLRFHGQKVKLHHIIISAVMGQIISFVTPLTIGGDGIGYWYLRRKGFKRAPLSSTFLTATILWQVRSLIMMTILVPMGFTMYSDILLHGDAASKTVLTLFIVGIVWDVFSIFMIWMLVFNRRFQEWIVSTTIKLLEWMPYVRMSDPGSVAAGYQYEFATLRAGMKKIWTSPKMLLEAMAYELSFSVLAIGMFLPMAMGIMQPGLQFGPYWSQIISRNIVNTANSFSLTPGSVGFIEFITIKVNSHLFTGGPNAAADNLTGQDSVISIDIMNKFLFNWPMLAVSTVLAISIIFGESRNRKHELISKNKVGVKTKTTFYWKFSFVWILLFGVWLTILMLF